MAKPFLTYSQQIEHLREVKRLSINDCSFAENVLKNVGYFSLIGGYKTPFIDPMTRIYHHGVSFEDIVELYQFDLSLRELVFSYLCKIECKVRQFVSYAFCSKHGEQQYTYLDPNNYNNVHQNSAEIQKSIKLLSHLANKSTEHIYITHQRKKYGNIPLWVLLHALTFGQISKIYALLPFDIQSGVSKEFSRVDEKGLASYLRILTLFRNVCAHNERLYSFRTYLDFPDTILHQKLKIPKKGSQYTYGKRDLFGLVIAFRYLLSKEDFKMFKKSLLHVIKKFTNNTSQMEENELLSIMGFPKNWKDITKYRTY